MPVIYQVVHLALMVAAVATTWRAARGRPRLARGIAAGVVLLLFPTGLLLASYPWVFANALGWADLVFFSRFNLLGAAILATAAFLAIPTVQSAGPEESADDARVRSRLKVRIGLLGAALLAVAGLADGSQLQPEGDRFGPGYVDADGVVRQTAPSSCAAAAAATLLRALDVDSTASEADLASLCLTDRRRGTSELGLYRGLRLSAPDRRTRFDKPTLADLRGRRPCLVFVGLARSRVADPELYAFLRDRCSWNDGEVHAVVLLGFAPGQPGEEPEIALVADPRLGLERWPMSHFEALWSGLTLGFH